MLKNIMKFLKRKLKIKIELQDWISTIEAYTKGYKIYNDGIIHYYQTEFTYLVFIEVIKDNNIRRVYFENNYLAKDFINYLNKE